MTKHDEHHKKHDPKPTSNPDSKPRSGINKAVHAAHRSHPAKFVRNKLVDAYRKEPEASEEIIEATQAEKPSKHQAKMLELKNSGKTAHQIQQDWHDYYKSLTDIEKHQVWREFYSQHGAVDNQKQETKSTAHTAATQPTEKHSVIAEKNDQIRTLPNHIYTAKVPKSLEQHDENAAKGLAVPDPEDTPSGVPPLNPRAKSNLENSGNSSIYPDPVRDLNSDSSQSPDINNMDELETPTDAKTERNYVPGLELNTPDNFELPQAEPEAKTTADKQTDDKNDQITLARGNLENLHIQNEYIDLGLGDTDTGKEYLDSITGVESSAKQATNIPSHQSIDIQNQDQLKERLLNRSNSTHHTKRKLSKLNHLRSVGIGLGAGALFLLVMLFSFFNERFITPFITPSKYAINSSIIIDQNASQTVPQDPKVIIPSINIEAPVVYTTATSEEDIQRELERGTYHYPTTAAPGENGNVIIFGHSSNNILNKGQYKFVFLSLSKVEVGDLFYLNYNGVRYTYKVFNKRTVEPNEVALLNESPKPNMATLITCDPPGTSLKRLLIEGEQISPEPAKNVALTPTTTSELRPAVIPSNSPSLWSRIAGAFN